MEVLSDLLRDVKLAGAVFLDVEFRDPWCIAARGKFPRLLMPDAEHIINYHFIVEGRCRIRLERGNVDLELEAGDVVVAPHGDAQVMGSAMQLAPRPLSEVLTLPKRGEVAVARYGGNGAATRVVCGFIACDPHLCGPILSALPRMFKVSIGRSPSGEWLQNSIRHSVAEAASLRAGADVILARLSEVLFVEALRCYVEALPAEHTGWLAGLRDPLVGKSLRLLHGQYERAWTVDQLASEVGCSRSVLAERFTHYVGQPPMQYLTKWRLARAASRLRSGGTRLARIAADVGYESEAAFNRAFKREFGMPPALWRRRARPTAVAGAAAGPSPSG
jgi:AraC family transcriptional regulator, alkane utilization regulator